MHRRKGPTVTCHMFFPHRNPLGRVLLHMITILSTSVIPTLGGVVSNMFLFFLTVFRGFERYDFNIQIRLPNWIIYSWCFT